MGRLVATFLAATVLALTGCAAGEGASDVDAAPDVIDGPQQQDSSFDEEAPDAEEPGYDDGLAEGEEEGAEAGAEAGHQAGYDDAESGNERGDNFDAEPNLYDAAYDPDYDSASYEEGYEEGYSDAYRSAYESSYEEGYDEALAYYRDPTIENPYDEDCEDTGGPVIVSEDDPDNLDYDGDGIGCDS